MPGTSFFNKLKIFPYSVFFLSLSLYLFDSMLQKLSRNHNFCKWRDVAKLVQRILFAALFFAKMRPLGAHNLFLSFLC